MKYPDSSTHVIDIKDLQKDIFRLFNLCYGFGAIVDDMYDYNSSLKQSALFANYGLLFEKEATSLLLKISINCRVIDDISKYRRIHINPDDYLNTETLGLLFIGDSTTELSARECFNKIIHASTFEHEIVPVPDFKTEYYMPEVLLTGTLSNKEWAATIYLLPFCRVLFDYLEDCLKKNVT